MMDNFKAMMAENEIEDQLNKFFQVMKKFNNGKTLPKRFTNNVHQYIKYRSQKDKNLAISIKKDRDILDQLPLEVQDRLYT